MIHGDIEVPNPTHCWISEVGVTVQPAHTDSMSALNGDEEDFSWLIELVKF